MPLNDHDEEEAEENEAVEDGKDASNIEDGNSNLLLGEKSPSKNGKLEGIVINATPKARIKNAGSGGIFKRNVSRPRNLHVVESAATLRPEHGGSNRSLAKSWSRPSLVSNMVSRILPGVRSSHTHLSERGGGGGGGRNGSNNSLHSKNSRRRRYKKQLPRSFSRVSDLSQQPSPSLPIQGSQGGDGEDIFKMSSMSSLNSHLIGASESEFSSMHNSKLDLRNVLQSDIRTFHRCHRDHVVADGSNSGLLNLQGMRTESFLGHGGPGSQTSAGTGEIRRGTVLQDHGSTADQFTLLQNKLLKQKLESIQTLQNEIMQMLDTEIEAGSAQLERQDSLDPTVLVQNLENRTDLLRRHISRRHHAGGLCPSPDLISRHDEGEHLSQREETGLSHEDTQSRKSSIQMTPGPETGSNFAKTNVAYSNCLDDNVEAGDANLPSIHYVDEVKPDSGSLSELAGNPEASAVSGSPGATSEVPSTTFDLSLGGGSVVEADPPVPVADDPEELAVESGGDGSNSYENELSTIEEQPELGYHSDSSETDTLLVPIRAGAGGGGTASGMGGAEGGVEKKGSAQTANFGNLPTVLEEDHGNTFLDRS